MAGGQWLVWELDRLVRSVLVGRLLGELLLGVLA